ncbi:hypothetical protein EC9_30990 [Rosistilla ulvae]|uniref:Uncharacterized protein n=1 Tax=Rosistilla ulvae TaxID=1930277 RepID=A0A517M1Z5_9BACT|nr:glycosyltransferase [Rosistilla ulvae]QDS88904.1 hypothetical protein EC9_30990 [Rosistilla ulvae]
MNSSSLAPIVLFVYGRPEHTRATLESLSRNGLAKESLLYIFADGPRNDASLKTLEAIKEVRKIIRERPWCGEVKIVQSDINRGLAKSIVEGVGSVCEKHGDVIVLEDDLETSPGFLRYMNDGLAVYRNDSTVMQISAFNIRNRFFAPQTGFLRTSTSWGWATWQRAWSLYQEDANALMVGVQKKDARAFDLGGVSFHHEELQRNIDGDLSTWAVKWYATIFLHDGLCLYPRKTMVRNLGFDGTGENCHEDAEGFHRQWRLASRIRVSRQPVVENNIYLSAMQRHYRKLLKRWTKTRLRDRLLRKLDLFR